MMAVYPTEIQFGGQYTHALAPLIYEGGEGSQVISPISCNFQGKGE